MRIAFIGQKGIAVSCGGVERRVQELSTRMAEIGHEVFVYARKDYASGDAKYNGVNMIYLPYIATKHLGAITHTFMACVHAIFQKYDVVHFQAPGPSTLSWMIKIFSPNSILVATFNSRDDQHQKWGMFARAYLRFGERVMNKVPDKTIVVSEILRDYALERYGNQAVVIRNGSAVAIPTSDESLKKWGLEKGKYFLSVSRLVKHKGIHYLIEAFKDGQKNGDIPTDFKVVIVGDSANTDEYADYLRKISATEKSIIFVGNQYGEDLAQLFANAFAFVQPSEAEGLSNALLEAMGYGLLPIVSDIPENRSVVDEDGLIFENKNQADLGTKLIFAIKNPELTKSLGEKARANVEKNYRWDENVSRTLALYSDLMFEKKVKKITSGQSLGRFHKQS